MDNKELELAHDLLTADEEVILTKAVQAKGTDCDEMKKLQEVYGNFVASVAKEYLNNGLSLDELVEVGKTGLAKGAMKYDHSRGFRFISYAVWWIRESILYAIADKK
jgi:RNA polymerase primary sigma factor